MSREASNRGGMDRASLSELVAASPSSSEDGVRKLVTLRKKRSSELLVVTMEMAWLSGTSSLWSDQVPWSCGCRWRRGPARFREW